MTIVIVIITFVAITTLFVVILMLLLLKLIVTDASHLCCKFQCYKTHLVITKLYYYINYY